jgi:hypothetical protein
VLLYFAPSVNLGSLSHYDLPMVVAVGVVGTLGMVRCAWFVSVFYLITFLYAPSSSFVLGFGNVCLCLYCCVGLQVCFVVLPMFYVWSNIVFGVCYVCVVLHSGMPTVFGSRGLVDFSVCRAVFIG